MVGKVMSSERKYPHSEITEYSTELFLEDFHKIYRKHINEIVVSCDNTTRTEVQKHLERSLLKYLGLTKT